MLILKLAICTQS
jgi:hypothetical protein